MNLQKRVVAIHDISCLGKCSLTVAMPIISAAGIEVSIIPTAVLSTHTGGFSGYTYRDLTEDMLPVANHWNKLDIKVDAVYTGFLGSYKQLDIVAKMFDMFKSKENIIMVDPVMADNGKLYKLYDKNFADGMKELCKKADIIVPNITEAVMLLDEQYHDGPYEKNYIQSLLKRLGNFGAKYVVITGVCFDNKKLGVATYDRIADKTEYIFADKIDGFYHGTGDVFASVLLASLLKNNDLVKSAKIAVNFTVESIERTKTAETDKRYGVNFEEGLLKLARQLKYTK